MYPLKVLTHVKKCFIDLRGERGERERHGTPASCMHPILELNRQPLGARDDIQPTEPHRQGLNS